MSFSCDHCGFSNNEIQPAAEIEPKGARIELTVNSVADLNRKVVKSDHTSVRIVELDFEIPAQSQRGEITTLEGMIDRAVIGLEQDQPVRRIQHPEDAKQIDSFVVSLEQLKLVESPWTVVLEDISGNCFVENPNAPHIDPSCIVTHFNRTPEQDHELGMFTQQELRDNEAAGVKHDQEAKVLHNIEEDSWPLEELHGQVLQFETICSNCKAQCMTNMKMTSIPHFKDVVIMATVCDSCGVKTNEVKSGGGIEDKGVRFEVTINSRDDMSRDVLKSDNCSIEIPELDCEVGPSCLAGRFTTIEGLLASIKDQLSESGAMFRDSEDVNSKIRMDKFIGKLDAIVQGETPCVLILDDPSGNSYVQALTDDGTLDDRLKITKYTRSFEQDDELGINDMRTENY